MTSFTRPVSSIELVLPPQNAYLYRNRPLPLPPTTLSRTSSKAKPPPRFSAFPQTLGPGNDPKALPQEPPVIVPKALTRQRASRMSISGTTSLRERRSSQKIQQITGHDVGPGIDWTSAISRPQYSPSISPKSMRDDSSSGYGISLDEPIFDDEPTPLADYQPRSSDSSMPPLEPDCDSVLSNHSYTSPESPKAQRRSVSLHVAKTKRLSCATSTMTALEPVPNLEDPFDEDVNWQAGSCYNYFSDLETADEYHRIATRLANNDKRQSIYGASSLTRSRTSLSRRLSVGARSLFTRRKDSALSTSSSRASLTAASYPTKGPYSPSIPPSSETGSVVSPPHSTFEIDDEDELYADDGSMREVVKDFFARRSEERNSMELGMPRSIPQLPEKSPEHKSLTRTGVQVKDLISNARDGARLIQARGERRRTQLRTQIKMIPEEEVGR
ncbi:hypothetical protein H9Q69_012559 [Fusarium xylarioides]|nr:hypothetical protein H9Q70_014301 [Fusarium xylarioides]KAG5768272.1 hypothetical protein H9Q73_013902 [Fusarium xylarioides]KAG5788376.1 hypothetical protein H9Q69_012559 [Fusarium xylarioides]KAG5806920.1 hypothetical protein H9Q71_008514 [Fusarium xylarioides]KAG5820821.1 hypothetical protein H9Q74_008638 [Fusarium xylarioides]